MTAFSMKKTANIKHFWVIFDKSWKIQTFTEIEIFAQKCCRGAQNDRKSLKIILLYTHVTIWSILERLEQKMQKKPPKWLLKAVWSHFQIAHLYFWIITFWNFDIKVKISTKIQICSLTELGTFSLNKDLGLSVAGLTFLKNLIN